MPTEHLHILDGNMTESWKLIGPIETYLKFNFGIQIKRGVKLEEVDAVLVIDHRGNALVIDENVVDKKRELYLSLHAAAHILLGHHLIPPYNDIIEPRIGDIELLNSEQKILHQTADYLAMGILNKRIGRFWPEIWSTIDLRGASEEMEDDIKADSLSLIKLLGDYNHHHDI